MITAVIFDRDGVLTDFDLSGAAAFFKTLIPVSLETLSDYWHNWGLEVGFPSSVAEEKLFRRAFWRFISDELDLSPAVEAQLQQVDYRRFLKPFPDARPALLTARKHNLKVGVLSNFSLASLSESLTAVGLAGLIDEACTAAVIGIAKPHPEAYATITDKLEVKPQQCLFFDDEAACVAGARAVGMRAYLVNRTLPYHDLTNHIVSGLSEIEQLF